MVNQSSGSLLQSYCSVTTVMHFDESMIHHGMYSENKIEINYTILKGDVKEDLAIEEAKKVV